MLSDLASTLADPSRPSFLFGVTPPREGTSAGECREICAKFVARQRALATDGFIIYDIQDESSRNEAPRPFPFRALLDPSWYAALFQAESGKGCLVYKVAPNTESEDHFRSWVDTAVRMHRHRAFNLVGAASSTQENHGPSVEEAAHLLQRYDAGSASSSSSAMTTSAGSSGDGGDAGASRVRFGCVAIAERHRAKRREHDNMLRKIRWGAEWFVTQGIFDAEAMIELLNDYGALCRSQGLVPRKVVLTFVPCGRRKTLQFIKWLGMDVPPSAEEFIFGPPSSKSSSSSSAAASSASTNKPARAPASSAASAAAEAPAVAAAAPPTGGGSGGGAAAPRPAAAASTPPKASLPKIRVARSLELNRANLVKILDGTSGCGVPLGLNVESVSGYRDEIDAAHHLFRDLQTVLLDHRGSPWMVRWYDVPRPLLPDQPRGGAMITTSSGRSGSSATLSDEDVRRLVERLAGAARLGSGRDSSSPVALVTAGAALVGAGVVLGWGLARAGVGGGGGVGGGAASPSTRG